MTSLSLCCFILLFKEKSSQVDRFTQPHSVEITTHHRSVFFTISIVFHHQYVRLSPTRLSQSLMDVQHVVYGL